MVTKIMPCKICGAEVVRTFPTEQRAKHCTYVHCDECKAKNSEKYASNAKEKNRKGKFVGRLKNDEINDACDRFFQKRNINADKQLDIIFIPNDTTQAVQYGEAAARRYMKGVKDGN